MKKNEINEVDYIESLGNLLATYRSDLIYIQSFADFKKGEISEELFLSKKIGSFQKFINDFRVARNISKEKKHEFLKDLMLWVKKGEADNVDELAKKMSKSGYTHGKVMTSLCSKVLFLNNPYEIVPIDRLAKKTLGYKGNNYSEFKLLLNQFKEDNKLKINSYLKSVEKYLCEIEIDFNEKIQNIEIIRVNRYLDKILWTKGR
ncbi:MAG: hypothetical protein CSA38_04140 [Flavobacteriales bacterium]|nr:MAG: hypothetical protein CSA38_04140 [Flavobacteriales bacterium]